MSLSQRYPINNPSSNENGVMPKLGISRELPAVIAGPHPSSANSNFNLVPIAFKTNTVATQFHQTLITATAMSQTAHNFSRKQFVLINIDGVFSDIIRLLGWRQLEREAIFF